MMPGAGIRTDAGSERKRSVPEGLWEKCERCGSALYLSLIHIFYRMKLLGATVVPVTSGSATLKDALNEAMRDWVTNVQDTFYIIGTCLLYTSRCV